MKESLLVRKIKDYIASIGGYAIKYPGGPYSERGVPDLIFFLPCLCCRRALIGFCEVKTDKGVVSVGQARWIAMAKSYGALAFVARSVSEVEKELRLAVWLPVEKLP